MKKIILLICCLFIVTGCDCVKYVECDDLIITKAEIMYEGTANKECRYEVFMGTTFSSKLILHDKNCGFHVGDKVEIVKKGVK